MTNDAGDITQTSRSRLILAAKKLFAKNSYEQTSTAAIAREAGTSESQLIRYFGGKAGLFATILDEAWTSLSAVLDQAVAETKHGREAVIRILSLMIQTLNHDREMAFLYMFEAGKLRTGSQSIWISRGYVRFIEATDAQIARGQEDGSFRADIDRRVLRSAILGTAEGLVRDRALAEHNRTHHALEGEAALEAFAAMVNGLAP